MDPSKYTTCQVCFEQFDTQNKKALGLMCGHTFCKMCIKDHWEKNKPIFTCFICRTQQNIPDINNLQTNYQIQDLLMSVIRNSEQYPPIINQYINGECRKVPNDNQKEEILESYLKSLEKISNLDKNVQKMLLYFTLYNKVKKQLEKKNEDLVLAPYISVFMSNVIILENNQDYVKEVFQYDQAFKNIYEQGFPFLKAQKQQQFREFYEMLDNKTKMFLDDQIKTIFGIKKVIPYKHESESESDHEEEEEEKEEENGFERKFYFANIKEEVNERIFQNSLSRVLPFQSCTLKKGKNNRSQISIVTPQNDISLQDLQTKAKQDTNFLYMFVRNSPKIDYFNEQLMQKEQNPRFNNQNSNQEKNYQIKITKVLYGIPKHILEQIFKGKVQISKIHFLDKVQQATKITILTTTVPNQLENVRNALNGVQQLFESPPGIFYHNTNQKPQPQQQKPIKPQQYRRKQQKQQQY